MNTTEQHYIMYSTSCTASNTATPHSHEITTECMPLVTSKTIPAIGEGGLATHIHDIIIDGIAYTTSIAFNEQGTLDHRHSHTIIVKE